MEKENFLANLDEETQRKIQEIQNYEHGFQQLLIQKKSFRYELEEIDYALKELEKTEEEVFKIIAGQIVIRSAKDKLLTEMNYKKKLIEARLKNIEKQEEEYSSKIEKTREEIMKKLAPRNK